MAPKAQTLSFTLGPVNAVILLIPEATASWETIVNPQIWSVVSTWVPPQSSIEINLP